MSGVTMVATWREQPAAEPVSQFREASPLAVVEAQALPGESGFQQSILFPQERDDIGLLTIEPAAQRRISKWNGSTREVYATAVDPHVGHCGFEFSPRSESFQLAAHLLDLGLTTHSSVILDGCHKLNSFYRPSPIATGRSA